MFISPLSPAGPGYDAPGDHTELVDEKEAVNLNPYDFRATFENPYASKPWTATWMTCVTFA